MPHDFLSLAFNAPLVAVSKRWPNTLHAAGMESIIEGWARGTVAAACGKGGLRLLSSRSDTLVPWPPRVSTLPIRMERCRDCYRTAGVTKVRSEYRNVEVSDAA